MFLRADLTLARVSAPFRNVELLAGRCLSRIVSQLTGTARISCCTTKVVGMKHHTENRRNDNVPVQQRLCHQHDVFQDRHSPPPSRSSVMIGDSQLPTVNDPGMQPCSATTVEHTYARCQGACETGAAAHVLRHK